MVQLWCSVRFGIIGGQPRLLVAGEHHDKPGETSTGFIYIIQAASGNLISPDDQESALDGMPDNTLHRDAMGIFPWLQQEVRDSVDCPVLAL